jgi:hypothetical protein
MLEENKIVHTLWVGSELSLLERLTIKLLQSHGHEVYLWTYGDVDKVPSEVLLKNAEEILPKSSIFKYTGKPLMQIPNGGIGSLSHWSDQFQLKLLSKYGGIYMQLDVACLRPLSFEKEYAFASHSYGAGLAAFIMKCPKNSEFTKLAYSAVSSAVNPATIFDIDWGTSMRVMGDVLNSWTPNVSEYMIPLRHFMDLGCAQSGPFFDDNPLPKDVFILHWSNATVNQKKNDPIKGSIYHSLLTQVGLI